ncbi:UDP-glucose--hexose-1-phosphate uridylyltransferase [Allofustis seminis]|uniref:UDP-glucose--hexose-1-phosphate uridylyltransferase n=1 Tax=Allofustis seminis TaxID=166939 RepID=UPI000368E3D4|nr:UDP-glucose--hexose-1-phosphate uridylyltransferase [Allofustis seminis]
MDQWIINFVELAIEHHLIDAMDRIYFRNRLLALLGKEELDIMPPTVTKHKMQLLDVLDQLVNEAVKEGIIQDIRYEREILSTKIMDLLTPLPSEVNQEFWKRYQNCPKEATDYFYQLGKDTNYIKTREVAKNMKWQADSEFGPIELTINLSKPEKDPHMIKRSAQMTDKSYPHSALSPENEGYPGSAIKAARSNHRFIRLEIQQEEWGLQFSPYVYYSEHCIFFSIDEHPMKVSPNTIVNLLEIIDQFPHYFVGSNAGLPIVGGSILAHDHYQGGRYTFPIERAKDRFIFSFESLPHAKVSLLDWPMSVLRIESADTLEIERFATAVFDVWEAYSDPSVNIYSHTDAQLHNAITSIARKKDNNYQLDLILRNNRTNSEFPDGIFHAHPAFQHIKKENIGLIEVMGLAILPPRLQKELNEVKEFLLKNTTEVPEIHRPWAEDLLKKYSVLTEENCTTIIQQEVGNVFIEILKNAGVFKLDNKGQQAFLKFMEALSDHLDNKL